ncbi:unnamed protein product [Chondrus crispus]|uniref:Uncharacterized protein n=1 Tax=Chondrus crispus TaxID=2769 RepID=R7QFA3_CHOCR|nr:unnamed protein product [Chondrus crispus]CDF36769.1 unnamed protein product [Chondrus crispus]|eukprot:XP_005716588.1 unnamed protein product [Chondrus crispus]
MIGRLRMTHDAHIVAVRPPYIWGFSGVRGLQWIGVDRVDRGLYKYIFGFSRILPCPEFLSYLTILPPPTLRTPSHTRHPNHPSHPFYLSYPEQCSCFFLFRLHSAILTALDTTGPTSTDNKHHPSTEHHPCLP